MREDAARPSVIRRGIDSGGLLRVRLSYDFIAGQRMEKDAACPGCVASELGEAAGRSDQPTSQAQTGACEKDAARPRVNNVSGKAARREAARLLGTADLAHVEDAAQLRVSCSAGVRSRAKRQTCLQQTGALRPTS